MVLPQTSFTAWLIDTDTEQWPPSKQSISLDCYNYTGLGLQAYLELMEPMVPAGWSHVSLDVSVQPAYSHFIL